MDFSKDYIGRVVYNEDPTFSGRCKVEVFGVFDGMTSEELPWINPKYEAVFSNGGAGALSVPKVGNIVRVHFDGNLYTGEYSYIQNIDPALIEEIQNDYQNTHVLLYDSGKSLIVVYQPMTGFKISLGGSFIKVDADGSIQLKHSNNSNVVELNENKINITTVSDGTSNVNGEINITGGATVNITSPNVNVISGHINLGEESAPSRAVKGEALVKVLKKIVSELNDKFPKGSSSLTGKNFDDILSNTVKLK